MLYFRPDGYEHGYVVSWKVGRNSGGWTSKEMEARGDPPAVTIEVSAIKPFNQFKPFYL